jgi:hypothetical protein
MILRKFPDQAQFQNLARTYNVIPLAVEILADMETPVSLLTRLYRKKGSDFSARKRGRWREVGPVQLYRHLGPRRRAGLR